MVYLTDKGQELMSFMQFNARVFNQQNRDIKVIRSDRDTVFTQPLMMAYCKERGITQQFAAVGRQDQNGLVPMSRRSREWCAQCWPIPVFLTCSGPSP